MSGFDAAVHLIYLASAAYSRNVSALTAHLLRDGAPAIDPADEIQAAVVVTHDGVVVNPLVRKAQ